MSATHPQAVRMRRAPAATLLVFLLALVLAASAHAAETQNHQFKATLIGGLDSAEKPPVSVLDAPCGVAVRPNGSILVSDYYRRTILGATLPEFFPENGPCTMASDPFNVYVNYRHGGVANISTGVIDPGPASGIAVDPTSFDLFVDHRTSIAVYEAPVDPGDAPSFEIDPGSGGALGNGYGVAVSAFPATEGYVYVADASDNTVKVYDPSASLTAPVQVIDGAGTAAGRFVSLKDASLAIDQTNGHLFVVDNTQPGFEHPLAAVDEFNAAGLPRGQLEHAIIDGLPTGIVVDESATSANGLVYVTSGNGSSAVIPPAGGPPASEQGSLFAFGPAGAGQVLTTTLSGSGSGSVSSSTPGISCPGSCQAEFNSGTNITLVATAAVGSTFVGWSGACTGSDTCKVNLGAAATVNAQFDPAPVPLAAPAAATAAAHLESAAAPGPGADTQQAKQQAKPHRAACHNRRAHHKRAGSARPHRRCSSR